MLPLRILFLLLLCLSSGMSATLGLYRGTGDEDTPAPEAPALGADAADPPLPPDALEVETVFTDSAVEEGLEPQAEPAPEEPAAVAPAEDEPIADLPSTEEPVADGPLADEEPVPADVPAADAADPPSADDEPVAVETVADSPLAEEEPVAESPLADGPVVEAPAAEEPIIEVLTQEAPGHETPVEDEAPETEPPAGEDLEEEAPGAELALEAPGEDLAEEAPGEPLDNELAEHLEEVLEELAPSMVLSEESSWGISSIRDSFQAVNGYFDSLVELVGGRNGVCQYQCRYGKTPVPRPGYQIPEPNGCSNSILGFQFDMGIPAMTVCCDQLDTCYDTCGASKSRCDSKFRWCVHGICNDLKRSLGFVSKVQACESMADALYNTVWTLGCRSYMSSQKAACFCEGEERDEL